MCVRLVPALALALLGGLAACYRPSPQCRAFYDLSPQDRTAKMRSSPVGEQIDLYYCGMMKEPPSDFSVILVERGEEVIPALLDRLERAEDESFKDDLIHVLEVMATEGKLRKRQDVVERVRAVVSKMKYREFRDDAQRRLATIEGNV